MSAATEVRTQRALTAANVRTGRWRSTLSTGTPREDGLVPVYGAVTMSPATRLSRLLLVPQGDVHRFRIGTPFLWKADGGEAVVVAVGAAAVAELTAALAAGGDE